MYALARLDPLLAALRQYHRTLKEQNQKILETGTKMGMTLVPIEDGIRVEREEKLAKEDEQKAEQEVMAARNEVLGLLEGVDEWTKDEKVKMGRMWSLTSVRKVSVLKPSEFAPSCAKLLVEFLPNYLDPSIIAVGNGDVRVSTCLLEQMFDHISYTCNATMARIVAEAAAKHLTPCLIEFGSKNPDVYGYHMDADLKVAARKVAWGRTFNGGQACLGLGIIPPGTDESDLFIPPTILKVTKDDPLIEVERFGPVITDLEMESIDEGIEHELPLSGMGESGYGKMKGKYSVDSMSCTKGVLYAPNFMDRLGLSARYPGSAEAQKKAYLGMSLRSPRLLEQRSWKT
ncbi:Aldehyde/histidinol dehydrogenase [Kalaharituber pfeilii]|nr:Aldehyde/histidinol dehydrogenase [Kalaharituber pfeilii]